jgi:hypothetical protein
VRVLVAGASGVIGTALTESLIADGHLVRRLVRRETRAPGEFRWDPGAGELDGASIDGVDAVVCLSGAGVGDRRWTPAYKQVIRESRTTSVSTIAAAMARAATPPTTFIAASAVGYYGDTGPRETDENGENGDSFLASVCRDWERAAAPAVEADIRVVHPRTGIVVGAGGLMARLTPLFRTGIGGRIGNGRQYWPWISLADEIGAIRFLIEDTGIAGPVNLCAPNPVTNQQFTKTLASVLHRPAVLPVPGFALRIVLGEFAGEVLVSQRAVPSRLIAAGFRFHHVDLGAALRAALAA